MTIRRELIDELLKEYETPQDIVGEGGLLKELTKAVIEETILKLSFLHFAPGFF
jgi:putative transposase